MTELFEVEDMIEEANDLLSAVLYEAGTTPGNGEPFRAKLITAAANLKLAIASLTDAAGIISAQEGDP